MTIEDWHNKRKDRSKKSTIDDHLDSELSNLTPPEDINSVEVDGVSYTNHTNSPHFDEQKLELKKAYIRNIASYLDAHFIFDSGKSLALANNLVSTQTSLEGFVDGIFRDAPDGRKSNQLYQDGYIIGFKLNLFVKEKIKIPEKELFNFINGYLLGRYDIRTPHTDSPYFTDGHELGIKDLEKIKPTNHQESAKKDPTNEFYKRGLKAGLKGDVPTNWHNETFLDGYVRGFISFILDEHGVDTTNSDFIPTDPVQYYAFMEGLTQTKQHNFSMYSWMEQDWFVTNEIVTPDGKKEISYGAITSKEAEKLKEKEQAEKDLWLKKGETIRTQYSRAQ